MVRRRRRSSIGLAADPAEHPGEAGGRVEGPELGPRRGLGHGRQHASGQRVGVAERVGSVTLRPQRVDPPGQLGADLVGDPRRT